MSQLLILIMKTAIITLAGVLAIVAGILAIRTAPAAAVFAFLAGAGAFGSIAFRDKR